MKNQRKHIMLHCFTKDNSAKDTTTKICNVYRSYATSVLTIGSWFRRFRTGNFNLEDKEHSGRPFITNTKLIMAMVNENARYIIHELADILNIPRTTVHDNLRKISYINLSEQDLFLKKLITRDETDFLRKYYM
ncbi:Histone-lysine N-methyltransferase SETMAR [Vespula maculifrons]|uniref:Histone-lysine N-methyltransferase SETMAR n=1 Tax=Vespula maculifrons TaxID=7453 RepID=A0ABD2B984_VESMC